MVWKYLEIGVLFFFLLGCRNKDNVFTKAVEEWQSKEIVFPVDLDARILGRDTFCNDLFDKQLKVLIYIDSSGCTPCRMHLFQWNEVIKECKEYVDHLAFIFVVHTDNPKKIDIICEQNKFDYPIFYDCLGKMEQLNHFPKQAAFQTFLLEKDNKVKLIGDPLGNQKLMNLYMKIINEVCKKNQ